MLRDSRRLRLDAIASRAILRFGGSAVVRLLDFANRIDSVNRGSALRTDATLDYARTREREEKA